MMSLSMDVEATRGAVAVIFFLFICFLIAANFFDSPERLRCWQTSLSSSGWQLRCSP